MKLYYRPKINITNDEHSQKMFRECVSMAGEDNCDYAYFSCPELHSLKTQLLEKKLVLIAIKDNLHLFLDCDWMSDSEQILIDLAAKHPDKLFVIFLEYFSDCHLERLNKANNIKIVLWFGNLLDDHAEYVKLVPASQKNYHSEKTVVCLNRYARSHRLVTLSYLYGAGLEKYVHLSLLKLADKINEQTTLLDLVDWNFSSGTEAIQDIIKPGFSGIFQNKDYLANGQEPYDLVLDSECILYLNNAINFKNNLHDIYSNTFLEIITETMYDTKFGSISEKYLNSVYGYNFPIVIAVPGAVEFLRDIGFDMFDDIVDHSYDQITDPLLRIDAAIKNNMRLITNRQILIDHWKTSITRFDTNLNFARTVMLTVIQKKSSESFIKCLPLTGHLNERS